MPELLVDPHPHLAVHAFQANLPAPLAEVQTPEWLQAALALEPGPGKTPVQRSEELRKAVRDLLRFGGYKPTGRGKPASEYLVKAASQTPSKLGSINLLVDACNVVSLHSGLPISVVDLDRATPPLRVGIADKGTRYVFNASGQEIDLSGLLCLFDREGPCANGVKDSQRTKTHAGTERSVSIVWAPKGYEDHVEQAVTWYRELLQRAGATTGDVSIAPSDP